MPLPGIRVDPLVVDPRGHHGDRARGGQHVARLVIAIADHQPTAVVVEPIGELLDIGANFRRKRRMQHLAGAIADDLVQHRPTRTSVIVGPLRVVNYRKHGRTFPTSAPTPVLIRTTGLSDHPREGAPTYAASPRA